MKAIEKILMVAVLVLLVAGIVLGLRNIDFFNIEEVEISVYGPVTNPNADMMRLINPVKGRNIFEVNITSLRRSLEAFNGVKSVKVTRYFPDRMIIEVTYEDIRLKAFSVSDDGTATCYFIYDDKLEEITTQTWEEFDKLSSVELNPAYARMVQKHGADAGFRSMASLAEHLASNNLITSMKYDNNNGSDFGRLAITVSSLNAVLNVRELVGFQRLDEALDLVLGQFSANGSMVVYDLYANTLVKRT